MKTARRIFVCLVLFVMGAYIFWQFHTGWGLAGGLFCEFLMLCIGFATDIQPGLVTLKANAKEIAPVVKEVLGIGGTPSGGAS